MAESFRSLICVGEVMGRTAPPAPASPRRAPSWLLDVEAGLTRRIDDHEPGSSLGDTSRTAIGQRCAVQKPARAGPCCRTWLPALIRQTAGTSKVRARSKRWKLMSWSFPIGRLFGSEIRIHVTFVLFLAWIAIAHYQQGGTNAAVQGVAFILALFACVVAHEFGHALAAKRYGIKTPDITLLPIGGLARLERMPEKSGQEIVVALAGPAVNVVIAVVLILFMNSRFDMDALQRLDNPGAELHGAARFGERLPRAVQPDPGLPDGRRARAQGDAGDLASAHAGDQHRRADRPGARFRLRFPRPDGQSAAHLHRHLRLSGGDRRGAVRRPAGRLAQPRRARRHDHAFRDARAAGDDRRSGRPAAFHHAARVSRRRRRRQAARVPDAQRHDPGAVEIRAGNAGPRSDDGRTFPPSPPARAWSPPCSSCSGAARPPSASSTSKAGSSATSPRRISAS